MTDTAPGPSKALTRQSQVKGLLESRQEEFAAALAGRIDPGGTCECGCGGWVPAATRTRLGRGYRKGEPMRFLRGHHTRGEANHNWCGGRVVNHGYVYILAPEHPNAGVNGYVAEHVMIAAAALGRAVPKAAEVHHANRVRDDNRPENLVLCPSRAYHKLIHRRMNALRECGHADWRRCAHCGKLDAPEVLHHIPSGLKVYHLECNRAYQRNRAAAQRRAA